MSDFYLQNDKIYSNATGDAVAVIEAGAVKMLPGKNAMTPRVKAFYEEVKDLPENAADPADDPAADPDDDAPEEHAEEVNTHKLADVPAMEEHIFFGGAPNRGGTSAPAPEKKETPKDRHALSIWDIPQSDLPAFSPALGVETPEFKSFVKKHKLSKDQCIELIKRLERRK